MLVSVGLDGTNAQKTADVLGTATQVAGTALTVIAGMQDAKKRREFEQALAYLSNDQKKVLESQLNAATTNSERLKILVDAVKSLQLQRINIISGQSLDEERRKRMETILYVSAMVLIGGVAVYLIVKNA